MFDGETHGVSLVYLISGKPVPKGCLRGGVVGGEYATTKMQENEERNKKKYKKVYDAFYERGGPDWFNALTGLEIDEERIYRDIFYFQQCLGSGIRVEDEMQDKSLSPRQLKDFQRSEVIRLSYKEAGVGASELRSALVSLGTSQWADMNLIKPFYKKARHLTRQTGIPHQVDHIVPINHKRVCGLHNQFNLQVITRDENMKKGNRFYS